MKKIIDENGRLFGKVSIIDFFVLLIVLVIVAALVVKFNLLDVTRQGADLKPVTYTVAVNGVRQYSVDSLKPGDVLFDKGNGGNAVGTITAVDYKPAVTASEKIDGSLVNGSYEGYFDVILTIKTDGIVTDGRTFSGKTYELNVNSNRNFYTKYTSFEATITGLE
ncbi:DUF4330 domain-containing protein [Oscillospiraceae bacterium CM]|nr:DUF4330 domain-containing protein [Oscillospiraceae bacterium CM]